MDRLVDFSTGDVVKIHSNRLEECKKIVKSNNEKKRYRICLHDSTENMLQEMIICHDKEDYARPAKHKNCPETHTILDGRMAVVLFENDGKIRECFVLDRVNGYLSCRINAEIYHMLIPLTETAITYETKVGPFTSDVNIFPDWAPDEENKEEGSRYLHLIMKEVLHRL